MRKSKTKQYPENLGELLKDIQLSEVYPDSMTFPNLVPISDIDETLKEYKDQRNNPDFDLKEFAHKHFKQHSKVKKYKTRFHKKIRKHIEDLWDVSTVKAEVEDKDKDSLIPLPNPYVIAGGRFNGQWYWDSYFIMLGLIASGRYDMVEGMLDNFAFLIDNFGFIPSGNRTYYTSRSQPPFFSHMILLLNKESLIKKYLPYLVTEYKFWMQGSSKLSKKEPANQRVVRMPDGELLNRYYDDQRTPRVESYKEDLETVKKSKKRSSEQVHLDLRAAAESGWDFSSRWMKDKHNLYTTSTTELVPIDLNSLLVHVELVISKGYKYLKKAEKSKLFENLAKKRVAAIQKYCYSDKKGFFFDYNFVEGKQSDEITLAGVFPLFTKIATKKQAEKVAKVIRKKFLKRGGLVTTLQATKEQWDSPNGWASLQWTTIRGLRNYHQDKLADKIKKRWIKTNKSLFRKKGKLVEKYNVIKTSKTASGGEYSLQDGFGMTNGVLLALLDED